MSTAATGAGAHDAPPARPARFTARVQEVVELGGASFLLRLSGAAPLSGCRPGQFAMLRGDWGRDPLLPRAMSVMRARPDGTADFLMKEVGRATRRFRAAAPGDRIDVLGPLGRPFPAPDPDRRDLLVAGGVGLAPLLMQAEAAAARGLSDRVTVCYGGRTAADLVLLGELGATGAALLPCTEDGSAGARGRVTDVLDLGARPAILACGPTGMLRALHAIAIERDLACWLSLEEEMGCGVRACLGCAVPARGGDRRYLYLCSDGPVLSAREIWP